MYEYFRVELWMLSSIQVALPRIMSSEKKDRLIGNILNFDIFNQLSLKFLIHLSLRQLSLSLTLFLSGHLQYHCESVISLYFHYVLSRATNYDSGPV